MKLETGSFGYTQGNEEVLEFILSDGNGSAVHILNFGAAIRKLLVPDKNKESKNVVLGFDTVKDYEHNPQYLGVAVGRYAGRISNAEFIIDDIKYRLNRNNGNSCLHGGIKGLSRIVWNTVSQTVGENEASIAFSYRSVNGEEHFPGNVLFGLKYTFNDKKELLVEYTASTDKATPINLTNHSYFNLNGDLTTAASNHELMIDADTFVEGDESTLGIKESAVDGTLFDFRKGRIISEGINSDSPQIKIYSGYDHAFRLNTKSIDAVAARLRSAISGIEMTVRTSSEAIVFYSSNFMDDSFTLVEGKKSKKYLGICLETQYFPNDLNVDFIETKTILRPGETYKQKTIYAFNS